MAAGMIFKKWFVDEGGWLYALTVSVVGYLWWVFP